MNLAEALKWTEEALSRAGISSAKRESEILLSTFLDKDLSYVILHPDEELLEEREYKLRVARRCCREPLQYILGEVEFFGIKFKVKRGVFIPRPETEILVEEALKFAKDGLILDLGVGCGNILLSLLAKAKGFKGVGVDLSAKAIMLSMENAERLGLRDRVLFINCDWGESLKGWFEFDMIVSNPPYIPKGEIWNLEPEVLLYEPVEALDGGEDGTLFYRRTIDLARVSLKRGGILAVELGKEEYLSLFFELEDFSVLSLRKDYEGRDRVIILKKNS